MFSNGNDSHFFTSNVPTKKKQSLSWEIVGHLARIASPRFCYLQFHNGATTYKRCNKTALHKSFILNTNYQIFTTIFSGLEQIKNAYPTQRTIGIDIGTVGFIQLTICKVYLNGLGVLARLLNYKYKIKSHHLKYILLIIETTCCVITATRIYHPRHVFYH